MMKAIFIEENVNCKYRKGQELEAKYPANGNKRIIVITDESGNSYGYPAKWFEVIPEDESDSGI